MADKRGEVPEPLPLDPPIIREGDVGPRKKKLGPWESHVQCPDCDYHRPLNGQFDWSISKGWGNICPGCGVDLSSGPGFSTRFKTVAMQWESHSVWYLPNTWKKGKWTKKD